MVMSRSQEELELVVGVVEFVLVLVISINKKRGRCGLCTKRRKKDR